MAEEAQELKEYVITKVGEDGQTSVQDKSSKGYSGKAQVQYPNGDLFDGMFHDGVREGSGVYSYGESGNKYEGEWLANLKHGIGKMTFANVGEYYGRFENGKRQGEGVYKYTKTKDLYSGSWQNGLKHGKGTFIFNDTKMKIVGEWAYGQIVSGRWIFANGTYFEGIFENNFPKGQGTWHFANGNVVKGEFTHELRDNPEGDSQLTVIDWESQHEKIDPSIYA